MSLQYFSADYATKFNAKTHVESMLESFKNLGFDSVKEFAPCAKPLTVLP